MVIDLIHINNKYQPDKLEILIHNIAQDSNLHIDANVPKWLIEIFYALCTNKAIKETRLITAYYNYSKEGRVRNFLAELEDILEGEWDDFGGGITLVLFNINMKVFISFESSSYEVSFLK
ncbi:hypothetical protein MRY82_07565 [bacterium]|nr:hypothetical protein [bacterium]